MIKYYITTDEVAKMHNVTRGCVVQWITGGYLPATKVNQIWLVKESDAKKIKRRKSTGRPRKNLLEQSQTLRLKKGL